MIEIDGTLYSAEEAAAIIRAARQLAETLLTRSVGYTNIMIAMPEIGAALDGVIVALDSAEHGSVGLTPVFARREDAEALFPGAPILAITSLRQG